MADYTPRDYVIFRRMSPHLIPGLGPKMILSAGLGLAIGLIVFFCLGLFSHEVTRAATLNERTAQQEQLTLGLYSLKYEEGISANESDPEGAAIVEDLRERYLPGKSDEEIEKLSQAAREAGITPQMKPSDIAGMLEDEVKVKECPVPMFWRVLLSCVPFVVGVSLFIEINGASIAGELAQKVKNRRAVKVYVYRSFR